MDSTLDNALEFRRTYPASPARVFGAWTHAETLAAWFAPTPDMTTVVHELDVRVGGRFRIEMRAPNGAQHIVRGSYTACVPAARLGFTWMWEGREDEESHVEVLLEASGAGTELVLRHTRLATAASQQGHRDGWYACLDRLQGCVS